MKRIPGLLLALFLVSTISAQSAKQALLEKLLTLTQQPQSGFDYWFTIRNIEASDTPERDRVTRAMKSVTMKTYAAELSDDDLRQAIAFFETPAGKKYAAATAKVNHDRFDEVQAAIAPTGTSAARDDARETTVHNLNSLVAAVHSYATDNNVYPNAKDIDALIKMLQPTYLAPNAKRADAWGTAIVYLERGDKGYTFISAGPDRKIDKRSLTATTRADANNSDDIIYIALECIQNCQ